MAKAKKESTFEKDLAQLEGVVAALEEGGLPLDDSLKQFEAGVKLARRCEQALTEAEKRIEILLKNASGELEAQPFEEAAAPGEPAARKAAARDSHEDLPPEPEEEEGEDLLF